MRGLRRLFEPIQVGPIQLKNRIKLPAMAVGMGEEGSISEQMKAFYAQQAKGGVGFMVNFNKVKGEVPF